MTRTAVSTRSGVRPSAAVRRRPRFALFSALLVAFALLVPGFAAPAVASAAGPAVASSAALTVTEAAPGESTDHLAKKKKKKSKFGLIVLVVGVLIVVAVIVLFVRRKRKR